MNVAFWFMKHAAMLAVKAEVKMEEAKEVHTSLRKAAGLFLFVQVQLTVASSVNTSFKFKTCVTLVFQDSLIPQLIEKTPDGGDLDIRVIAAYLNQCKGEAQEV